MTSPVLIVTYARSAGLIRLIESSLKSGVKSFFIAIDGPRNQFALSEQAIMKKYLENFQLDLSLEVNIWWRKENLGPAVSVLSAINWFFENVSEGIVLEDDLEPEDDFFKFANLSLLNYRDVDNVWIISGSRLIEPFSENPVSTWSNYPMTWGWATWANKWQLMYRELLSQPRASLANIFDRRSNYWDIGAKRSKGGFIDAWDLPLASAQFRLKKLTLIPPVNLIRNVGFDSQATHTISDQFPLNIPTFQLPMDYQHPKIPTSKMLDYDSKLEDEVYRITIKHSLLRVWSFFTDRFLLKLIYELPLVKRIEVLKTPNVTTTP